MKSKKEHIPSRRERIREFYKLQRQETEMKKEYEKALEWKKSSEIAFNYLSKTMPAYAEVLRQRYNLQVSKELEIKTIYSTQCI